MTSQPVLQEQYVNKYRPQDYHVSCDLHTQRKVLTLGNICRELSERSVGQRRCTLALAEPHLTCTVHSITINDKQLKDRSSHRCVPCEVRTKPLNRLDEFHPAVGQLDQCFPQHILSSHPLPLRPKVLRCTICLSRTLSPIINFKISVNTLPSKRYQNFVIMQPSKYKLISRARLPSAANFQQFSSHRAILFAYCCFTLFPVNLYKEDERALPGHFRSAKVCGPLTTTIIIIINKKEKTCTLIDVAIPADRNVVQKEAEKKLKYKSLCIEIQRMWNLKCTIVPVIIEATGIVTRSLKKNLETIPGKHSIDHYKRQLYLEHHT